MDATQIKFTPGQPIPFIATKKFALGNTGVDISEGMEILFDGTVVEVNGTRYTLPQLRGSIRLGWIVPSDTYDPDAPAAARPSANIQVRAAVNTNQNPMAPPQRAPITTAESDEQVVMTRGQRTAAATQATQMARAQRPGGGGVARSFNGAGDVEVGGAEFGVPVARTLKTSAKAVTEVTRDSVGQAIMAADKVKIDPGQGQSEEEMLASMTDAQRDAYLAKKEAARASVTSRLNPNYSGPPITQVAPAQTRVVGQVKTARSQSSEGIKATVTTGGGTETYDASGSNAPAEQSVVEAEGIRFSNTNGPKRGFQPAPQTAAPAEDQMVSKIEKDGTADARKKIAKALCPDFPDSYSFSEHWKRRLAMIRLHFEGRADVIRAIFAAESDDFKKVLMEEFPEVFAS